MVAATDSKALTVYERMPDQLEAVKVLGNAIARSGMFGCGSPEAGMVFAAECMFRNLPPLSMAERYHVIFGKLSMKAEAMLAGFEREGGKYKVLTRTSDLAAIEMTIKGQSHTLSLSWDDAQKEPFVYLGKEDDVVAKLARGEKLTLKPKYATPRARMQMLWARLVSDSVRFLCPSVVSGVYTPEEIEDFDENQGPVVNGHAKPAKSPSVVDQAEAAAKAAAVDAEFEARPAAATAPEAAAPAAAPADALATPAQVKRLSELAVILQCGDKLNAAYAKRGCSSARSLKAADAQAILDKLETQLAQQQVTAEQDIGVVCGPATEVQVERVKEALRQWAQIDPTGYQAGRKMIEQKLAESGRQKVADLSADDAARLYDAIQTRKLDAFIRLSLESWQPKEAAVASPAAATAATEAAAPGN